MAPSLASLPFYCPVKTMVKTPPAYRRCKRLGFDPWVGKIPSGGWRSWQPIPVFLPGVPDGGHGNPFRCSCLEYPWTEDPGRLQSMGTWLSDCTAQGLYWRWPELKRDSDESFWLLAGSEVRSLVRRSHRNKSHCVSSVILRSASENSLWWF